MANPNFSPTFSSDEIWRGQDTNRCLSDDLDNIEGSIASIDSTIDGFGNTYAALNHVHSGYASTSDVTAVRDAIALKADVSHEHDGYARLPHNHNEIYYTQAAINSLLDEKASRNHTHTVDASFSETSVNPVQNKVVKAEFDKKASVATKVNGKALSSDIVLTADDIGADKNGSADAALTTAKKYTDTSIANLIGSADSTMDTLGEIQAAMQNNADVVKALDDAIGNKANIADLSGHIGDNIAHVKSSEKSDWNTAYYHSLAKHAPANAQENQNAFSNVSAGGKIISADTETDTFAIEGSNITVSVADTEDKVVVGLTDVGVTGALGYKPADIEHVHTAQDVGAASRNHTHSEYLSVNGGTVSGDLKVNGEMNASSPVSLGNKLVFANNTTGIFGTHDNGNVYHQFQPVNANGYCAIGYGMYSAGVGGTDIYGNKVSLVSKNNVSITGDINVTSKAAGLKDRAYGVNKVLWSGAAYLHANQTISLSEAVTAQPNGIVLVFSAYKVGTGATDTYWQHFFVPKYMVGADHAGGTTFIVEKSGTLRKKYIYINDNGLRGSDVNDDSKYVFHGQTVDNREVVLRYVIGV